MTEEWRQEKAELVAEIARLKNMIDTKEALAFKPQYGKHGSAKEDPKEPLLRCAFCRKPLSTKMVSPGYQSDITMFCSSECKDLYAKSREELRILEIGWHHLYPEKDISLEELAELDLLAKLTAEFPGETGLIREIKDGLITIGDRDQLTSAVYSTGNMRGIRAHLRSAKALRDGRAEAIRKIAEVINDSIHGDAKIGIVSTKGFNDLDEDCDLAHLLKALAANGSVMNAPWGAFKGDGDILSMYTTERVQELRERLAKSAAASDALASEEPTSDKPFNKEVLFGLGMLTGSDILAMSPEQRDAIKQRIREAKEKRKDHPSPAMGAFRVQGSNGDVIEPLIPGKGPNASARTTCMHSPASLLGSLYGIGAIGRATPKSTSLLGMCDCEGFFPGRPKGMAIHIDLAQGESKTVVNASGVFDNRKTMFRERWEDGVKVSELACDEAMETNESFPWGSFPDFPANMMGPQPPDETEKATAKPEPQSPLGEALMDACEPELRAAFNKLVADEQAAEEATEPDGKEPCAEPVAQKARVICGFPGVGKTYYHNLHPDRVLDSDSSKFSWLSPGVRNPEFPGNYIKHIQSHLNEDVDICVSSHAAVRDALRNAGIEFIIVMPPKEDKEKFLERYRSRHNDNAFITLLNEHWEEWLGQLEECPEDTFIADSIHDLVCGCAPN